ncbi:MAG: PHP domain-containing protein [Clostridia bacterium]|nr:PHP domain-containing protein [Clostridia bacterium]
MRKFVSKAKKGLAVLLAVLCVGAVSPMAYAADTAEKNYIIDNPYEGIDWDSWGNYKTQLHCHTTASDGFLTIDEFCKMHYATNYDIVALTDHGTLNLGWNKKPEVVPLMRAIKKERTKNAEIIPIPEEEYQGYLNGTNPNTVFMTTSGYKLERTKTNGMIDIPLGNELNMATPFADCHLTGYYAEYGQGLAGVYGDYETPSKGVKEKGGISFLSHVGEYVYPDKDSENYVGQKVDDYYATKFAKIFIDNAGSSLGMGINSATDAHTRCDRILYDQILQKTIPNGVVPWCNTFADSHNETAINDAYTMSWMPELTTDAFRTCLEKGQYFSISHYSNGVELDGIPEIPGFVEQEVYDTERYWLDNTPNVTRVTVDQDSDTITVEGVNFNRIVWVSNGNVIKREENITSGTATLDLHNDEFLNGNEAELYVRFYITGENGICYSQPMVLNVEGESFEPVEVKKVYDLPWFLRGLVTVLDVIIFRFNPLIWIFKYFGLGYNPVTLDRLLNPF